MKNNFIIFCLCILFSTTFGKLGLTVDDNYEKCASPEESFNTLDVSGAEIVTVNDTHSYLNGTAKFLVDLDPPWPIHFYIEKLYGNKWATTGVDRMFEDFCEDMHRPYEPWFKLMSHFKGCPYKKDELLVANMIRLNEFKMVYTPSFKGRWRATIEHYREIDGIRKKDCTRIYSEIAEE
ncbi:CLUMA_CG010521, isoform A [Clunio marinus]|uniref:CLUMA_CG010521, isoform A n=1 Tax=Clunio marinus TaxID=568069 RepID=A0A1J1IC36_9DIPT|nr:CLUMA_CG010521, isoform A [Clunio marinus]